MSDEMNQVPDAPVDAPVEATVAEPNAPEASFLDTLPEDLRGESSLENINDIDSLAKGYVNAQRMIGSSVRIPTEDSSDEAKAEFYEKLQSIPGVARIPDPEDQEAMDQFYNSLGRPETPQGYDIPIEGADMQTVEGFKEVAHKLGLTSTQAKALAEFDIARTEDYMHSLNDSYEKGEAALRKEWGGDFNNRIEGAKSVVEMYEQKFPEAIQELKASPLANNPALLSMMAQHHKMLKESGADVPTSSGVNYGTSSAEALDKISEITSNPSHAYFDSENPGHAAAVQKVRGLYQIAYPSD